MAGFGVPQDREQWQALVSTVMNRLHKILVISWLAELLLASQDWLIFVELDTVGYPLN
jgi:hypothetical protein